MSTFPQSPKLLKAGLVLLDPATGALRRVIALQYNPDTLTRTLQPQGVGESGDRSEALRLKGPAVETIKLEAEIDATDQLEFPDQNPLTVSAGILPELAALETLVYPASATIVSNENLVASGTLEILPAETDLAVFVWGASRVVAVRATELSITEEAFDPQLNPIRAKVSLGLRVLSVTDLPFDHKGANLYMAYQRNKENLASKLPPVALARLGLGGAP
jgi:hypothetical protein